MRKKKPKCFFKSSIVCLLALIAALATPRIQSAILDPNLPDGGSNWSPMPTRSTGPTKPYVQPLCSYNGNWLNCSNFHTFSQLNFKNNTYSRQEILIISPIERIPIDETLDLTGYDMKYVLLKFVNINGFPLIADPAKNIAGKRLWIEQSDLKFFHENKPLNSQCNLDLLEKIHPETSPAFFARYPGLDLWKDIKIPEPLCPILFKDANFSHLWTYKIFKLLEFDHMEKINATIKGVTLNDDEPYSLTKETLNPILFEKLETIRTYNAKIVHIDEDFFKNYPKLTYARLQLNNAGDFFRTVDLKWTNSVNHKINVNFSDPEDVLNNKNKGFTVTINDESNSYLFPDEDFCLFKNYAHNRLAFLQIESNAKLECTCTIYWLHKHKKYHSFDYVYNKDLKACFASEETFAKAVESCNFDERLRACDNPFLLTSTTRRPITTLPPSTTTRTTAVPITTAVTTKPNNSTNNDSGKLIQLICNHCNGVEININ